MLRAEILLARGLPIHALEQLETATALASKNDSWRHDPYWHLDPVFKNVKAQAWIEEKMSEAGQA